MTEPTHDDYAAKRLRAILKLLGLSVPLDDAGMMGDGLFTTLGMVRGALERQKPFAWVQRNAGFDSGAASFGVERPPGWPNAKPCYAAPQRPEAGVPSPDERLAWLHSPASNNVHGWDWGIYRMQWVNGKPGQVWATNADFSDLDAAMRGEPPAF